MQSDMRDEEREIEKCRPVFIGGADKEKGESGKEYPGDRQRRQLACSDASAQLQYECAEFEDIEHSATDQFEELWAEAGK